MTILGTLPRKPFNLDAGDHSARRGACFTELASVLAGEPFSSSPECVSPVIRRFGITLNDRLPDEKRQRLRPYVLRSLGTAGDGRDDERIRMCREWAVEKVIPELLDRAGLTADATMLRELAPDATVTEVRQAIRAARGAAWASWSTTRQAIRERVREAARERGLPVDAVAAVDAAVVVAVDAVAADAIGAIAVAVDAAVVGVAADASPAARSDAIYDAVYKGVREKLGPMYAELSERLLSEGLDLLDRMLPASPIMSPVIDYADIVCAA